MWLTGRLAPDHKTIADFRKDNGPAIRKVCAQFVALCREMGLLVDCDFDEANNPNWGWFVPWGNSTPEPTSPTAVARLARHQVAARHFAKSAIRLPWRHRRHRRPADRGGHDQVCRNARDFVMIPRQRIGRALLLIGLALIVLADIADRALIDRILKGAK